MFYSNRKAGLIGKCIAAFLLLAIAVSNIGVMTVIALDTSMSDENIDNRAKAEVRQEVTTTKQLSKPLRESPMLFAEITYKTFYTKAELEDYVKELQKSIELLNNAIGSADYTLEAVDAMNAEVLRLESILAKTTSNINKVTLWENEYYYATKTWQFLINQGYSEVVASAIIGNMMIETSGGDLCLNPTIYNPTKTYYGLCQWSLYYRPEVKGLSFEEQLDYLMLDIEKEFNVFGSCYRKSFTYNDFVVMDDPAEAALAFAAVYERCGSGSYNLRKQAAIEAFNYFKLNY